MQESEFQALVDDVFIDIEDRIDELVEDIDVENAGGVLTLTFLDGSQVILSRQSSTNEIWVAARSGGFHLKRLDQDWICGTTGEHLAALINRVVYEQGGVNLFD